MSCCIGYRGDTRAIKEILAPQIPNHPGGLWGKACQSDPYFGRVDYSPELIAQHVGATNPNLVSISQTIDAAVRFAGKTPDGVRERIYIMCVIGGITPHHAGAYQKHGWAQKEDEVTVPTGLSAEFCIGFIERRDDKSLRQFFVRPDLWELMSAREQQAFILPIVRCSPKDTKGITKRYKGLEVPMAHTWRGIVGPELYGQFPWMKNVQAWVQYLNKEFKKNPLLAEQLQQIDGISLNTSPRMIEISLTRKKSEDSPEKVINTVYQDGKWKICNQTGQLVDLTEGSFTVNLQDALPTGEVGSALFQLEEEKSKIQTIDRELQSLLSGLSDKKFMKYKITAQRVGGYLDIHVIGGKPPNQGRDQSFKLVSDGGKAWTCTRVSDSAGCVYEDGSKVALNPDLLTELKVLIEFVLDKEDTLTFADKVSDRPVPSPVEKALIEKRAMLQGITTQPPLPAAPAQGNQLSDLKAELESLPPEKWHPYKVQIMPSTSDEICLRIENVGEGGSFAGERSVLIKKEGDILKAARKKDGRSIVGEGAVEMLKGVIQYPLFWEYPADQLAWGQVGLPHALPASKERGSPFDSAVVTDMEPDDLKALRILCGDLASGKHLRIFVGRGKGDIRLDANKKEENEMAARFEALSQLLTALGYQEGHKGVFTKEGKTVSLALADSDVRPDVHAGPHASRMHWKAGEGTLTWLAGWGALLPIAKDWLPKEKHLVASSGVNVKWGQGQQNIALQASFKAVLDNAHQRGYFVSGYELMNDQNRSSECMDNEFALHAKMRASGETELAASERRFLAENNKALLENKLNYMKNRCGDDGSFQKTLDQLKDFLDQGNFREAADIFNTARDHAEQHADNANLTDDQRPNWGREFSILKAVMSPDQMLIADQVAALVAVADTHHFSLLDFASRVDITSQDAGRIDKATYTRNDDSWVSVLSGQMASQFSVSKEDYQSAARTMVCLELVAREIGTYHLDNGEQFIQDNADKILRMCNKLEEISQTMALEKPLSPETQGLKARATCCIYRRREIGFRCLLTGKIMKDPVVLLCGLSCERETAEKWVGEKGTDPVLGKEMKLGDLRLNVNLQQAIEAYLSDFPERKGEQYGYRAPEEALARQVPAGPGLFARLPQEPKQGPTTIKPSLYSVTAQNYW